MDKEKLFARLLDEYYDQFGEFADIMSVRVRQGIDVAIEMLQNRNGSKITFEYFTSDINEDEEPEMIYE